MTTCAQCLSDLSTMRVTDMRQSSPTAMHIQSCPRCASIAEEIAYAERRLSTALAESHSSHAPEELSEAALLGSERERRKEVGRWIRGILTGAGCVVVFLFVEKVVIPVSRQSDNITTETISLRCLTPEQAMEIATPYLRSTGSISSPKGMRIVTIKGKHDEFEAAISRVKSIDDAQSCALPNPVYPYPSPTSVQPSAPVGPSAIQAGQPTTSSDKPKRD